MAVLELTSEKSRISLTVRGEVGRQTVDDIRATLLQAENLAQSSVEVDLRDVTEFSRLGIAVLVAARRWFGDRLCIRGNDEVVDLLHDAGLTRVLQLAA